MDGHKVRKSVLGKGRLYVDEIEGCKLSLEAQPDPLHLRSGESLSNSRGGADLMEHTAGSA